MFQCLFTQREKGKIMKNVGPTLWVVMDGEIGSTALPSFPLISLCWLDDQHKEPMLGQMQRSSRWADNWEIGKRVFICDSISSLGNPVQSNMIGGTNLEGWLIKLPHSWIATILSASKSLPPHPSRPSHLTNNFESGSHWPLPAQWTSSCTPSTGRRASWGLQVVSIFKQPVSNSVPVKYDEGTCWQIDSSLPFPSNFV